MKKRQKFGEHFLNVGLLILGTLIFQPLISGKYSFPFLAGGVIAYTITLLIADKLLN